MQIESITARPDLIETVARWQWGEWGRHDPNDSLAARIARIRAQSAGGDIPTTFVATEGDMPLGAASFVADDMPTHPDLTPWLASVYVAPEARGHGVASALVRRVVKHAASLGVGSLYLFTEDARGLYAKLGWHKIGVEHFAGMSVTIMVIDIATTPL